MFIATATNLVRHDPGDGYPERPDRLRAVLAALRDPDVDLAEPGASADEAIARVHPPTHVERVAQACRASAPLDADTPTMPETWDAARLGVSVCLAATDAVCHGDHVSAFAAVRPPGHHAEPERAMGFCYFGNVAIAVRHAQAKHGVGKIGVLDFDVHHGNGTQDTFYDDASVFFASVHEDPRVQYPYTSGFADETGVGEGLGTTLNLPLPQHADDGTFLDAVGQACDKLSAFGCQLLLISAGFDAHADDPLGHLDITTDAFAEATRLAQGTCGRVVSCMEGGYDLDALAASVAAHVEALGD